MSAPRPKTLHKRPALTEVGNLLKTLVSLDPEEATTEQLKAVQDWARRVLDDGLAEWLENNLAEARRISLENRRRASSERLKAMEPLLRKLLEDGLSMRDIALKLEDAGHVNYSGEPYSSSHLCEIAASLGLKSKHLSFAAAKKARERDAARTS